MSYMDHFGADRSSERELAIAPVRGARAFDVSPGGWLLGITYRYPWKIGENIARCMISGGQIPAKIANRPAHDLWDCPSGNNGHGFYAYFDGSNTYRAPREGRVEAVVEGYGQVVLGTRGFRASRAEILALTIPAMKRADREAYEQLLWRYSELPFFDNFEEMVAAYPPEVGRTTG